MLRQYELDFSRTWIQKWSMITTQFAPIFLVLTPSIIVGTMTLNVLGQLSCRSLFGPKFWVWGLRRSHKIGLDARSTAATQTRKHRPSAREILQKPSTWLGVHIAYCPGGYLKVNEQYSGKIPNSENVKIVIGTEDLVWPPSYISEG